MKQNKNLLRHKRMPELLTLRLSLKKLLKIIPHQEGNDSCSNRGGFLGWPQWLSSLVPPSAQGMILEVQDRVPCQAPCMEPASLSACVSASLSLSLMNK